MKMLSILNSENHKSYLNLSFSTSIYQHILVNRFSGRTDAEAEAPILWPPDAKNQLIGKDTDAGPQFEGRRKRRRQKMRWLDGFSNSRDMNLSKIRKVVKDREARCAAVCGVTQ